MVTSVPQHSGQPSTASARAGRSADHLAAIDRCDHLTQQIAAACQAHDTGRVSALTRELRTASGVTALEALAANHQLTTQVLTWQAAWPTPSTPSPTARYTTQQHDPTPGLPDERRAARVI